MNQKAELKMQEENDEMQTDDPTEDMQEEQQDHARGCGDCFAEIAD